MTTEQRYSRQQDLINLDKYKDMEITIIGLGAVGRQVALQLAVMGFDNFTLFDDDVVDESNLGAQGFRPDQLHEKKVYACCEDMKTIRSGQDEYDAACMAIAAVPKKFTREDEMGQVVFCCVDNMASRRVIAEACNFKSFWTRFMADSRITQEVVRILTVRSLEDCQGYIDNLYESDEVVTGPCTSKSTYYVANITAGLLIQSFACFTRGRDNASKDYILALPSMEILHRDVETDGPRKAIQETA